MFDCPEQSQTSPTYTSFKATTFFPLISSWYGPPAFCLFSRTIHLPEPSATVVWLALFKLTVICSPLVAIPQTGIATSRCNTIWSQNKEDGLTSARSDVGINKPTKRSIIGKTTLNFLLVFSFIIMNYYLRYFRSLQLFNSLIPSATVFAFSLAPSKEV